MILDAGCGFKREGDINIDIAKNRSAPDIYASAEYMPFVDDCFKTVVFSHTLEHMEKPLKALMEGLRVSTETIKILIPYKYHPYTYMDKTHRHFFSGDDFKKIAELLDLNIQGVVRIGDKGGFYLFHFLLYLLLFHI